MVDVLSRDRDKQLRQYFHSGAYCLHDYGRIVDGMLRDASSQDARET